MMPDTLDAVLYSLLGLQPKPEGRLWSNGGARRERNPFVRISEYTTLAIQYAESNPQPIRREQSAA
jgi:hypothetical protein